MATKTVKKAPAKKAPAKRAASAKVQDCFMEQYGVKGFLHKKEGNIGPGKTIDFPVAASYGEAIRQGDLYIVLRDPSTRPADYVLVESIREIDLQMVPGNTEGSKHCLDSAVGVKMWRPKVWNEESFLGPWIELTEQRSTLHPTHGKVVTPVGIGAFQYCYQRELDTLNKIEKRARD